jgi:NAD(P)-dependent dehydrogenase (short-subunit alcohol dehydrogenase family)
MDISKAGALVTGGASGLGRATAEYLIARGAFVIIADLARSNGGEIAEHLGATFVPVDVTETASVANVVSAFDAERPLRILVNCAGTGTPARVVNRGEPMPLEDFEDTIRINLTGTFNAIRLAAARMVENELDGSGERGVIINTASVAAFEGQVGQVAYSASKGGIVGMTLPLARDLASRQIRVVTIAPGLFDTPLLGELPEEVRDSLGRQVPHPSRLGLPSEFASLVGHIVENAMLNGETIRLDGAIRMAPR